MIGKTMLVGVCGLLKAEELMNVSFCQCFWIKAITDRNRSKNVVLFEKGWNWGFELCQKRCQCFEGFVSGQWSVVSGQLRGFGSPTR
jgi:hypothetical protein